MKTKLLAAAVAAVSLANANAQTSWTYDFGTATGSFSDANSASTNFLPAPPPDGGTARVRVGTNGGGFNLVNPGGGSSLVGNASTRAGTSINKFSIFDFASPTTAFSVKFDMKLGGASDGEWSFFAGSGATYDNNAVFANAQSFTGLRWAFGTNGAILTSNRSGSSWQSLSQIVFAQDTPYTVEVLGNNGLDPVTYRESFTLNPGTWDLWIDGVRAFSGLGKAGLATNSAIDSLMFYGESSTGNAATIELDNIVYANHVVPEPATSALLAVALLATAGFINRRAFGERSQRGDQR